MPIVITGVSLPSQNCIQVNLELFWTLSQFMSDCRSNNQREDTMVSSLIGVDSGFVLRFKDLNGIVSCHDKTKGYDELLFQTTGFPWDGKTSSAHDARTLAKMIKAYHEDLTRYRKDRGSWMFHETDEYAVVMH